jgi:CDP-glycerol glycerophosphotransferase (TagB/SpsB family)
LLVDAGVYEPEQVTVCGFPRIDALLKALPSRLQALKQLGIPSDARVALYTSGVVARNFWAEILDSIESAPDSSDLYWIIKLHPRDKTRPKWESTIRRRQIQRVKVFEGEFDFYMLLAACDVHISFISTTLIEAAILGKPNLGLAIPYIPDPVGYAEAKAFLPVAPNQLGSTVHTILHDPVQRNALLRDQKKFAHDWCLHDGKAVQRIVRLVETTIVE